MRQLVIDNPVINSAFLEPGKHFKFTDDGIACWFIDSDYNEESFFDEPCKKLQRALKAEIDEDAWSTLYSTVSRPFDPPATEKIAVKVINHYGDEVLKVYEVSPSTSISLLRL